MRALVTGANGFLGANIVACLNRRGIDVRAYVRPAAGLERLAGLRYEAFPGDLTGVDRLVDGMRGCDWVFHAAGCVSLWEGRRQEVFDVNVSGTRRVLEAARRAGVRRLVYTSSSGAVGHAETPERPVTEDAEWNFHGFVYQAAKYHAELLVRRAARDGLPAVIVNPGGLFGERQSLSGSGWLLGGLRALPFVPLLPGGLGVSDAEDVAEAHVAAAERGRAGERYLLVSDNVPYADLVRTAARTMGLRRPAVRVPAAPLLAAARLLKRVEHRWPREPLLTADVLRTLTLWCWHDSSKAVRELGFRRTPAAVSLERAWRWLRRAGRDGPGGA
jgi:dihydroflavonol-4-reductase